MLWHCGLLDPPLKQNRTLSHIRTRPWRSLPLEVQLELRIWLAMPGFSNRYHAETLGQDPRTIASFKGGYGDYKAQVIENWLSATRDDCIRLCFRRPGKGHVPIISQLQMRRDYIRHRSQKRLVNDYDVSPYMANQLVWGMPDYWLKKLPEEIIQTIKDETLLKW